MPNTDTAIAVIWNTDTKYRTDFKNTENTEKPIPTSNTDIDHHYNGGSDVVRRYSKPNYLITIR